MSVTTIAPAAYQQNSLEIPPSLSYPAMSQRLRTTCLDFKTLREYSQATVAF